MITRQLSQIVALCLVTVAGMLLPLALRDTQAAVVGPMATPAAPTPRPSGCQAEITMTLSADEVAVCRQVTVTTRIRPWCPVCPDGIHVVYLQQYDDPSGHWMADTARASLKVLEALHRSDVKVGVVRYSGDQAALMLQLTDRVDKAYNPLGVRQNSLRGNQYIVVGAKMVVHMLEDSRKDEYGRAIAPCEIVVVTGYSNLDGCNGSWDRQQEAGALLKKTGATVMTGCPYDSRSGEMAENVCSVTKEMASNPRYYTRPPGTGGFSSIMGVILDSYTGSVSARLGDVGLDGHLPSGLTFVAESASEPPRVTVGLTETLLAWQWDAASVTWPHTVTYRVQPVVAGTWDIAGAVTIRDRAQGERAIRITPQSIAVQPWCTPPTPTPTVTPTPTDTATPEPSPTTGASPTRPPASVTATPTSTWAPTPTRVPMPAYLPLTLRERCVPEQRHTDVALVLDASTSMLEPVATGGTKLDAARLAAGRFLDALRLDVGDQAALVAFNDEAVVLQTLTADRALLTAAFGRVTARLGTRIHLGIDAAAAELTGGRHRAGNVPVVVLLTDGWANPEPAEVAVERAAAAKAAGITIFTIGLGNELDFDALARIASRPEYFHHAPDAAELAAIYAAIAETVPCPPGAFWGGR